MKFSLKCTDSPFSWMISISGLSLTLPVQKSTFFQKLPSQAKETERFYFHFQKMFSWVEIVAAGGAKKHACVENCSNCLQAMRKRMEGQAFSEETHGKCTSQLSACGGCG